MREAILRFIRKNLITKFVAGFVFLFLIGVLIASLTLKPIRNLYYGLLDGDWFLNVDRVVAEQTVKQNEELNINFCRSPRARVVAFNNIRTFYLSEDNQVIDVKYQVKLPDGISYDRMDDDCVLLTVQPDARPNDLGRYFFCQEFEFTVSGYNKIARFCSTEYLIVAPDTVERQVINETQQGIL